MKNIIALLIIISSLVSCSNTEEKAPAKKYSEDTNRAFSLIEVGENKILKAKPPVLSQEIFVPERKAMPVKEIISPPEVVLKAKEKPREKNSEKMSEKLIEINQTMSFYCMKHRNHPEYSGDENKCLNFVSSSLEKCQKDYKNTESKLLSCVLNRLKNRR